MAVDLEDMREAEKLLWGARCVLFDFDGPICRLFANRSSADVADKLRQQIDAFRVGDVLTEHEREDKDPHVVLRAVHRESEDRDLQGLLEALEKTLTKGELGAARSAELTKDADAFIGLLAERELRLGVVTNNSHLAAESFLETRKLSGFFGSIEGRTRDPGLMKPHPDVIERALRSLRLRPEVAVMIGDSPSDLEAANRAGVQFIGYGRNDHKVKALRDAEAAVVVRSYGPLVKEAREGGT